MFLMSTTFAMVIGEHLKYQNEVFEAFPMFTQYSGTFRVLRDREQVK